MIINEYLDLKHEYYILVPLNQSDEDCLYRGEIYDDNGLKNCFLSMIFYEDTFNYLDDRLFRFLNVKLDVLINMYDEEIIENNQIENAIQIIEKLINESGENRFIKLATELLSLFKAAKKNNTIVGFYF